MKRASNSEVVATWRRHFRSQPRSGLSIEKYCRREGIAAGTFYAWKRRLKISKATVTPTKGKRKRNTAGGNSVGTKRGGFVQVPLTIGSSIEVHFPDGTLVSLPSNNLDILSTTLQALLAAQQEGGNHD
jgi:transposase-like protein